MKKVIFLNIGWMRYYKGMRSDKIKGGGSFVEKHGYGHEIFNFLLCKGHMYGYVQPSRGSIAIERLGASEKDDSIDGILVVWVSKHPTGGVFVVGWYKNATIYRKWQLASKILSRRYKSERLGYYIIAREKDCKLLPEDKRILQVSRGRGGMGQSNVWYADRPIHARFRQKVLDFISKGRLPKECKSIRAIKSKPWQPDPHRRLKIEKKAIGITKKHFEKLGYAVNSVEGDNVGWDLEATLNNRLLRLEVKGLSHKELSIELTPNEYKKMREYRYTYRICVVTNALTKPVLNVFSFSHENTNWEDANGNRLKIIEVVGARMNI